MSSKFKICLSFVLAVSLVLNSCTRDPFNNDLITSVPVGLAVSLTGNFGPYGNIQKNGFLMAMDEVNKDSSSSGIKLVPCILDDRSNQDTCMNIFRDMISAQEVMVVIGPTSSNCAFSADTIAQKSGVPVVGISNTVPGITEMGEFIFRNSLPESEVIPNTIRVTQARLGFSRVAIIYGTDDAYTIGAYDAFKVSVEKLPGVSIVSTESIQKGDLLFQEQLTRVKDSNPDVIILAALVNEASRLMVQAKQLGIPETVRFIGGNSFNTSQLWQQAGQAAEGAICGSAWIDSAVTPGNSQFVTNYSSLYGSKPDQFAAQAYASVYIIADAIKRCDKISRQSLRDALAGTKDLQTVLGIFSFDTNRDPVHSPVVQELKNGAFVLFN